MSRPCSLADAAVVAAAVALAIATRYSADSSLADAAGESESASVDDDAAGVNLRDSPADYCEYSGAVARRGASVDQRTLTAAAAAVASCSR